MTDGVSTRAAGSKPKRLDTVRQTIVETVEAPRLQGISTADFVEFRKKREVYERRVAEKNSDAAVKVQLTTYKDSIDKSILQVFTLANWVSADSVDKITEEQLKKCVRDKSTVSPDDFDIARIDEELKDVRLERGDGKTPLETQVYNLLLKYTTVLQDLGYDAFTEKHPKLAVKHLLKRVTHPYLRNRMLMFFETRRKEDFQENFTEFVRELAKEAHKIDYLNAAKRFRPSSSTGEDIHPGEGIDRSLSRKRKGNAKGAGSSKPVVPVPVQDDPAPQQGGEKTGQSKKRKRQLPDCLNKECGGKHFLDDCFITSEEQKRDLKKQYWDAKKARRKDKGQHGNDGSVGQINAKQAEKNTSLFSGSFCEGAVDALVLTDQGADANVISPSILAEIVRAAPGTEVRDLPRTCVLGNANVNAKSIECDREVRANILLRVRHGDNLMLRGVRWLVSNSPLRYVYLARHVLAAIGINNEVLLAAARDRFGGFIDVPEELAKDGHQDSSIAQQCKDASIHNILVNRGLDVGSTFHSSGGCEQDGLDQSQVYVDLGDDPEEDLSKALRALVIEAKENGLSEDGAKRFSNMLERHRSIFDSGWENPYQPTWSL